MYCTVACSTSLLSPVMVPLSFALIPDLRYVFRILVNIIICTHPRSQVCNKPLDLFSDYLLHFTEMTDSVCRGRTVYVVVVP
jgi:hypothetical protein